MQNLKPCPFCGYAAVISSYKNNGGTKRYKISCGNYQGCGVNPETEYKVNLNEIIAAWNRRANDV